MPSASDSAAKAVNIAVLEHAAKAVADILRQLLEQRPRPQRACVFPQEGRVAQVAPRRPCGLVCRKPIGLAFLDLLCQMELQLLAEFLLLVSALQPPLHFPEMEARS